MTADTGEETYLFVRPHAAQFLHGLEICVRACERVRERERVIKKNQMEQLRVG